MINQVLTYQRMEQFTKCCPDSSPYSPTRRGVREKGGSILAAALLHGTLNAVAGFSLLAVERTNDLLVGVLGLPGFFLLAAFNLYLRRQRV